MNLIITLYITLLILKILVYMLKKKNKFKRAMTIAY